jgi:subtilisin family serine protease
MKTKFLLLFISLSGFALSGCISGGGAAGGGTIYRSITAGTPTACINQGMSAPGTVSRPTSGDIGEAFFNTSNSWNGSYNFLWGFENMSVTSAWDNLSTNVNEVVVAVIDTGVDSTHPDLAGRVLTGWNWVGNNNNTMDDHGHGTHVAGTIAAQPNSIGIVGVAPFVKILPLKVLSSSGSGYSAHVLEAIQCAAELGVDAINLSLGSFGSGSSFDSTSAEYNTYISRATTGYWGKKVAVFAAAGNNGSWITNTTPANAREAITVGAHKPNGYRCGFSNYGWKLDLSGPGCGNSGGDTGGILSLKSNGCSGSGCPTATSDGDGDSTNNVGRMGGTSMATPHVVGLAALAIAHNNNITPAKLEQALKRNANKNVGPGNITNKFRYEYGFGLGRAAASLDAEANDADLMGVRITCPNEGSRPNTTNICFRIEAGDGTYTWNLYDVYPADSILTIDLNSLGTPIATGNGSTDKNVTQSVSLGGQSSEHAIIVEVVDTSSGKKYYDTMELVP